MVKLAVAGNWPGPEQEEFLQMARTRGKERVKVIARRLGVLLVLLFLIREVMFEPFIVFSSTMRPTLQQGDWVLISKIEYGLNVPIIGQRLFDWARPRRGEIIVFEDPKENNVYHIRRVVGLPGDLVEIKDEELLLNSRSVFRQLLRSEVPCCGMDLDSVIETGQFSDALSDRCELWQEELGGLKYNVLEEPGSVRPELRLQVPEDSLLVLADNRDNAPDRAFLSGIPTSSVKGKVLLIVWSRQETREGWHPIESVLPSSE